MTETEGPYFDDLTPGQIIPPAPPVTIGDSEQAAYHTICAAAAPLTRSGALASRVTGDETGLADPTLVLQMAIGQSTVATRHVVANLFYRGVRLRKQLRVGATISTTVRIAGLSEASRRPDRPPRGKVLLEMVTTDTTGDLVLEFERCALLPFRDSEAADTGHHADLGGPESHLDLASWTPWVPRGWDLGPLGPPADWPAGETRADPLPHRVRRALDLVELTGNRALAHRDPAFGQHGRRLVYGGHTIGLAHTSLSRLVPNQATVIGWHACDHRGPVFEDDELTCAATLLGSVAAPGGRLLAFRVSADAVRSGTRSEVLDWVPVLYAP